MSDVDGCSCDSNYFGLNSYRDYCSDDIPGYGYCAEIHDRTVPPMGKTQTSRHISEPGVGMYLRMFFAHGNNDTPHGDEIGGLECGG